MWVLYTALGILFGIVLLCGLVMLVPVALCVSYKDGEPTVKVGAMFLRFPLKISESETEDKKSEGKISAFFKKTFGTKQAPKDTEGKQKLPLSERIDSAASLIKSIIAALGQVVKRIRINKLILRIVCADDDACDAAMSYAKTSSVVYALYGYLDTIARVRRKSVSVECDFLRDESEIEFTLDISVRIFYIFKALLTFLRAGA